MVKRVKKTKIYEKAIKNWPEDDRPREKLLRNGEHALSKSELLAILLRTGSKDQSALDLARKIMKKFKTFRNMSHTDIRDWKELKGIGNAKITQIKAAIEIGRRFREDELQEEKIVVKSAKDIVDILMPRMRDLKKEVFKTVMLDSKNRVIDIIEITKGTVNQANPIIREIFHKALELFATGLICVHNHPSGTIVPSREDKDFTKNLVEAGKVMQIQVLDHIIIGEDEHFSFADEGLMV
jgi:DNA repair protein RadC